MEGAKKRDFVFLLEPNGIHRATCAFQLGSSLQTASLLLHTFLCYGAPCTQLFTDFFMDVVFE